MHAVYFNVHRFLTPTHTKKFLEKQERYDQKYGRDDFTRNVTHDGLGIITTNYEPCDWWNFDNLFERQMKAKDAMFAQPGTTRRKSRNGYDPALVPEDEEDLIEY